MSWLHFESWTSSIPREVEDQVILRGISQPKFYWLLRLVVVTSWLHYESRISDFPREVEDQLISWGTSRRKLCGHRFWCWLSFGRMQRQIIFKILRTNQYLMAEHCRSTDIEQRLLIEIPNVSSEPVSSNCFTNPLNVEIFEISIIFIINLHNVNTLFQDITVTLHSL